MTRDQAEDIINNVLYGTDTNTGRQLAGELIEEMGTNALTDAAVIRLAQLHQQQEHIEIGEAERRWKNRI